MVNLRTLRGKRGDARIHLGISQEGNFDLSDSPDWSRLDVLQNLIFKQALIREVEIYINFVDCSFVESTLERVSSSGHLWGANDNWTSCSFKSATLSQMISPMNTFRACLFENVSLTNFKPYQTLFENCLFSNCKIDGMRAQTTFNRTMMNPNLRQLDPNQSVVFRDCRFSQTEFKRSYFAGVVFERSVFNLISTTSCDFSGVKSDIKWWSTEAGDPFGDFLVELLEFISQRCGQQSRAYRAFEDYLINYRTGKTASCDFTARLYSSQVPDNELEKIESELPNLIKKFPF